MTHATANSVSWDERIVVDNKYIDNFNVWSDIKFYLRPIKIFRSENIYLQADKSLHIKTAMEPSTIEMIRRGENGMAGQSLPRPIVREDVKILNEWKTTKKLLNI